MPPILSTAELVPFTPPVELRKPPDERRTYLFRAPAVFQAVAFNRDVVASGGRHHTVAELLDAMAAGLRRIAAEAGDAGQLEAYVAEVEAHRETIRALWAEIMEIRAADPLAGGEIAPDAPEAPESGAPGDAGLAGGGGAEAESELAAAVAGLERFAAWEARWNAAIADPRKAEIERIVAAHDTRYAAMLADNEVWPDIRGLVACRHFLAAVRTGEGDPEAVPRGLAGVPDAWLGRISEGHRRAIGVWVDALLRPAEGTRKNS